MLKDSDPVSFVLANVPSCFGGRVRPNWHETRNRIAIPDLMHTFVPQSYSDQTIEVIGCLKKCDLLGCKLTRYCQASGAFDVHFKNKEVHLTVDGEPFRVKNLTKVSLKPMNHVNKHTKAGYEHCIIIVRGPE